VKEIREKYSRQLHLLYAGDEGILGRDMKNGVSVEMKRAARDYGIQARALLIKIASLMIHNNVNLNVDNYRDLCSVPKRPRDPPRGQAMGTLGWLVELNNHEEIRELMNALVNMVIDQIHDREATVAFPNEDAEDLHQMGYQIWS